MLGVKQFPIYDQVKSNDILFFVIVNLQPKKVTDN